MTGTTPISEESLLHAITEFVRDSPANRHSHLDGAPIFDPPIFGVADGDDPLFAQYKTIIGPFHLTPREVAEYARPNAPAPAGRLAVLTWALPITEQTRRSNRAQTDAPSERWAHTRHYGERLNDEVRRFAVRLLQEAGYLAIAAASSPFFRWECAEASVPPCSNWSERHALFAAGQGTFSLSDGFITARGIAHRCGSVVTDMPLTITPRRYADHTENCLHFRDGTCGECIARCPAGAISPAGHDKLKCRAYADHNLKPYLERYRVDNVGCGLCQTGVPCECAIPPGRARG